MINELLEYCRLKSILNLLSPTELTVWRILTRKYSKTFHTPLAVVRKMDPEEVIMEVFEDQLDGVDPIDNVEQFLEEIYTMSDPNYEIKKKEDLDIFIKNVEEKQQRDIRLHKQLSKEEKKEMKSGKVDFSSLNEENER